MYCLDGGWTEGVGVGDGQHLLLLVMLGDEVVAVGVMFGLLGANIHWLASGWGFARVFVTFRTVSEGGLGEGLVAR